MTATPKSLEDGLSESWVDLSISPGRVTPVAVSTVSLVSNGTSLTTGTYAALSLFGEEYLRLLRDAQRESNQSSALVSLASSRRDSRCESPKSPPNSPNNELSNCDEDFGGIFINKECAESKDWVMAHWTSHNDVAIKPRITVSTKASMSLRTTKFAGKSLFSKEVMYTLFVSNILSMLIGAGIGLWLSKRTAAAISQYPLN